MGLKYETAQYEASYGAISQLPSPETPEVAFVGRSNVGKSSLLNKLIGRKQLARVSSVPGKTANINFFDVDGVKFVDLPGYGFAKVPDSVKKNWGKTIEGYLMSDREKVVFLLMDLRRIPTGEDMEMLKWLEHFGIEYYIIFTKADKLSNNEKFKQLKEIKKKLVFKNEDVFFYSSLKNTGRKELLDFIGERVNEKK